MMMMLMVIYDGVGGDEGDGGTMMVMVMVKYLY